MSAYTYCKQTGSATAGGDVGLGVEFPPQEVFRTEETLLLSHGCGLAVVPTSHLRSHCLRHRKLVTSTKHTQHLSPVSARISDLQANSAYPWFELLSLGVIHDPQRERKRGRREGAGFGQQDSWAVSASVTLALLKCHDSLESQVFF